MTLRKVNIIMAAVLLALTGCSAVPVHQPSEKYDRPILSAAQIDDMIYVDVVPLRPMPVEETVMASAD